MKITLHRGECFGTCPFYKVEVWGDGNVLYEGFRFVEARGRRDSRISVQEVRRLVEEFRRADFFSLKNEYRAEITDYPAHVVSIQFDDKSKTVLDYAGTHVGMPQAVVDLETAIDLTAATEKWIGDTREP